MSKVFHFLLFFHASLIVVLLSSCSHDSIDPCLSEVKNTDVTELTQSLSETNYLVSNSVLTRYLNLFHRGKSIDFIEPIVNSGDTLAYYVQFSNDGWIVISGDTRFSPLLTFCPYGEMNLNDPENYKMILGMVEPFSNKRKEINSNHLDGTWAFLLGKTRVQATPPSGLPLSTKNHNRNNDRGIGEGMWIPVDTFMRESTVTSPRLTNTAWFQSGPFNYYTPKENNEHCPVGCGPVAISQLLYHYYYNYSNKFPIPTDTLIRPNGIEFTNSTLSAWQSLVLTNYSGAICDTTAIFMSWVGSNMRADYHLSGTMTTWNQEKTYMNSYFSYREGFGVGNSTTDQKRFCDTLISSISEGSPVLVSSQKVNAGDSAHLFLIDQVRIFENEYVIRYVFDPYHVVTQYDESHFPQWCFQWPNNYDPEKDTAETEVVITNINNTYVRMNWGWDPYYLTVYSINDVYHILRASSFYIGESGSYTTDEQYFLTWTPIPTKGTYSGILNWAHHFSRNQ